MSLELEALSPVPGRARKDVGPTLKLGRGLYSCQIVVLPDCMSERIESASVFALTLVHYNNSYVIGWSPLNRAAVAEIGLENIIIILNWLENRMSYINNIFSKIVLSILEI